MTNCTNCNDEGWVCENHETLAWPTSCECGAGAPCPVCNREMACAPFYHAAETQIADWLGGLEPQYSGWNDHDEIADNAWNKAIAWVAAAIRKGEHRAAAAKRNCDDCDFSTSDPDTNSCPECKGLVG